MKRFLINLAILIGVTAGVAYIVNDHSFDFSRVTVKPKPPISDTIKKLRAAALADTLKKNNDTLQ